MNRKKLTTFSILCCALGLGISSTTQAAMYVGKVSNLSKSKPLILNSLSIKTGERQPPSEIPPEKSAYFSISDKLTFLTFVYGYADASQDPAKAQGPAPTCVIIMTADQKYRINATNPEKVECKIEGEDIGGVTLTIKDK